MINLDHLKYVYGAIDKDDLETQNIKTFDDFKDYIVESIISNLEYDFNIDALDYIDINNFYMKGDR
jgi:hypothetical protein